MSSSNIFASLSLKARNAILRLSKIREKHDLTIDEALIIVAVAECNFSQRSPAVSVAAAPVLSIAEFLNMPYETTRRRMVRLRDRGVLAKVGFDGYMVSDLALVRDLVELLAPELSVPSPESAAFRNPSGSAVAGTSAGLEPVSVGCDGRALPHP